MAESGGNRADYGGARRVERVFLGTHTPRLDEKGRLILAREVP